MSLRTTLICDGPTCTTSASRDMAAHSGWLRVIWDNQRIDLCSTDCALRYFAATEPLTTIPSAGDPQ